MPVPSRAIESPRIIEYLSCYSPSSLQLIAKHRTVPYVTRLTVKAL